MAQHEPSRVRPPKKRLATDGTNYTSRRRNEPVQEVEMEEVDEPSDFPMWKTVAVIVVIFACFAILYPKMFHPMLLYALGMGKSEDIVVNNPHPFGHERPDIPIMPGGPHPGMRMGGPHPSFKQGQPGPTPTAAPSAGKGFTSLMLPVYSVGVIVFLLYTLSKIMFKKPKGIPKPKYNLQYNSNRDRFEVGGNESEEELSDEELMGVGGMGNQELKSLQKRLNETESAMQKILQQLENLTNAGQSVDSETAQSVSVLTQQTLDNLSKFETYRAEKGVIPQSNGPDLLQSKSPEGTAYLQDLEKALLDFKSFTDDFMVKHIQEEMAKSGETVQPKEVENLVKALNEKEEILQATDTLQMGFDPMESEMENGIMSLPPTDGEIIFLNGNGEVEKKPVKKEKIVEISDGERPSCSDQQPIVAGHNQEFPETIGNGDFAHGVTMEEAEENTELTTNDELVVRQRKGRKRKPRKV